MTWRGLDRRYVLNRRQSGRLRRTTIREFGELDERERESEARRRRFERQDRRCRLYFVLVIAIEMISIIVLLVFF